jgi:hypothetical protein
MSLAKFKMKWEGAIRTLTEDNFVRVFERWLHCREKCISIDSGYLEKSWK